MNSVSEFFVFNMLDNLKPTASGADGLPFWFLKIAAYSIAQPLTHIYNLSLRYATTPTQWKQALISPIPKVSQPSVCSDFRPISLTPIPSRILEKFIVRSCIYPALTNPICAHLFTDQFAYLPSGSTEAALISIFHHVTTLLASNNYVRLIALDFSKAFDTVRHSGILEKLSQLPIHDYLYNWFVNFFKDHTHVTKFRGEISKPAAVNASVFQGSVIRPPMFVVNGSDLKPVDPNNFLDKYADDTYLIVSSSNEHSLHAELKSIESWAVKIILS